MGTGVVTYITAAAPYAGWVAASLGLIDAESVLLAGGAFGIVRGLVPFSRMVSKDRAFWIENLSSRNGLVRRMSSLAVVSAVLIQIS